MKKLLISFGILALGLGAFGLRGNKPLLADAALDDAQVTTLKNMMGKYIGNNDRYTKKSHIYLRTDTQDFDSYFHAGASVQERTTYYAPGALLMGDMDGKFVHINSGYANNGANMDHFSSQDGVNALNNAAVRDVDYTVVGKQMSDYFYTLEDLKDSIVKGDWGYNDGLYYHDTNDLTRNAQGDYNDILLKKFLYFAAPMLLQTDSEYLSFKSITINEHHGYLHICIYLSDSDSGKSSSGTNLLAESMVYAGWQAPGYYLVGTYDTDYDWQLESAIQLQAPGSGTNIAEKTNFNLRTGKYQICQLKSDGKTEWFHNVPNIGDYDFAEMDNNDISVKYGGNYSFFLNNESNIYITRNDNKTATFTFVYSDNAWNSWNPRPYNFALHLTSNQNAKLGDWGQANERMTDDNGTYTISCTFNGSITGVWFYFYQWQNDQANEKKTTNILGDVTIVDGGSYTITCNTGSFTWNNNEITSGVALS